MRFTPTYYGMMAAVLEGIRAVFMIQLTKGRRVVETHPAISTDVEIVTKRAEELKAERGEQADGWRVVNDLGRVIMTSF
jgi:hypothetical protein